MLARVSLDREGRWDEPPTTPSVVFVVPSVDAAAQVPPGVDLVKGFPAQHRGICPACGRDIDPGTLIKKSLNGWVHAPGCEPRPTYRLVKSGDVPPPPAAELPPPLPPKRRRPDPPWVRQRAAKADPAMRAQFNSTLVLHETSRAAERADLAEQRDRVNNR